MSEPCMNCGDPEAEPYDLVVRSNRHDEAYLCETCHTALEQHTA